MRPTDSVERLIVVMSRGVGSVAQSVTVKNDKAI